MIATARKFLSTPSPAARIKGLPVGVSLTSVRTFRSNDGQGFCANLKIDGKVIGTLEDDGNGGGTWYRPSVDHAEGLAVVDRLVSEWGAARVAAGITDSFMLQEALWNDLVEEALTLRDLKKKGGTRVSKGEPRVTIDCGDWAYKAVEYSTFKSADVEVIRASALREGFTLFFNGTEWTAL